jgi:hypothetical protein
MSVYIYYYSVLDITGSLNVDPMSGHVQDAVVVGEGGEDDKDVKDLVTVKPEVKTAGKESFRNSVEEFI